VNIEFFLFYVGWIISFVGIGRLLLENFKIQYEFSILINGFVGMLFVAVVATIYHFFLPVGVFFVVGMWILGFIGWIRWLHGAEVNSNHAAIYAIAAMVIFFAIPLFWYRYYDTGLYHIQAMRWVIEQPLQLGLANLHSRLGYNSIWFALEGAVDPMVIATSIPMFLLNGICLFLYSLPLVRLYGKKLFSAHEIFYFLTFIPIVGMSVLFLTSASPDLFMMLITFVVFIIIIKESLDPSRDENLVFVAVLFAGFAGMVKLFGFILFVFTAWYYYRHYGVGKRILQNLMFIPWLITGIATSGYIAFPLSFTRLMLLWSVPADIAQQDANGVVAWARMQGADSLFATLGNNNWVFHWITSPMVLMVLTEIVFLIFIATQIDTGRTSRNYIATAMALGGIIFWYWIAPEPRYALGFIFALPLTLLAFAVDSQLKSDDGEGSRRILKRAFAVFAILALVQGIAIYSRIDTSVPFSVPDSPDGIYAMRQGIAVLVDHDQAWNMPLPSSPSLDERFYYGQFKWLGMEIPIKFMGIMR
jgi:hypothetical protein